MIINDKRALAYTARVEEVKEIPGYDRVEHARVGAGWWCIVSKSDNFKPGDLCVYFEVDSKVPANDDGKSFDRDFLKKHSMAVDSFYSIDRFSYWYDRTDHNGYSIMDIMKQNPNTFYTFIFDRYNISNAIFNPIYTGVDIRDLTFDRDVYGIPLPDTVVWMRMRSFDVLKSLIAEKSNKDANEMDIDFLYKIWSRSEDMIKSDIFDQLGIRLVVVDCLNDDLTIKTKDEIFNFITNNVKIR